MEHFKYFQNKKCEFFPCHKVNDIEDFNCLFCYCPLYMLGKECGGNPKFYEDGTKNCSDCTATHSIKYSWDFVMSKWPKIKDNVKK